MGGNAWTWSSGQRGLAQTFQSFQAANEIAHGAWAIARQSEGPFNASIEFSQVLDFAFSWTHVSPLRGRREATQIRDTGAHFFCLMRVNQGHCALRQGRNESLVAPGSIAVWDSTRPADVSYSEPLEQLSLIIPRAKAVSIVPELEDLCGLAINGGCPRGRLLNAFMNSLADEIIHIPDEQSAALLHAALHLVGATFRPQEGVISLTKRRPALQRIQEYVYQHLGDSSLSVTAIAEALGYSTRYIHRLFADFDFTVSDWIRRRRLIAAQAALADGSSRRSIAQVAFQFGFCEQSHFSKQFKREFGLTPKAYRDMTMSRPETPPTIQ